MRSRIKQVYDKLLATVAGGAFLLSAAWFWRQQAGIPNQAATALLPVANGPAYSATVWQRVHVPAVEWPIPRSQSSGGGWLYDVFTPPEIFYHPADHSFGVAPARLDSRDASSGFELLAVKREPFRLQLVGYIGSAGYYLGVFASPTSPQTLLARPGQQFAGLNLTLKRLEVRKVPVAGSEFGPVLDVAAFAILQDEQSGSEVILDNQTRKLTERLQAFFTFPAAAGAPRGFHEGDTFACEDATYRVERIQLTPPEVVVRRTQPGWPESANQVLRPTDQVVGGLSQSPALAQTVHPDLASHDPASSSP